MLPELFQKTNLFRLLFRIDKDLAETCQQKGCPFCDGPLHYANYGRQPRGVPESIPEKYLIRFSLCCGREGCRSRTMPPSCRFWGRRVYWSAVFVVVTALRQRRVEGYSAVDLMQMFGMDRKTLFRWMDYFRDEFPVSAQWRRIRGKVGVFVKDSELPGGLLEYFFAHSQSCEQGLIKCLWFLLTPG